MATGVLLIREAGGVITNFNGESMDIYISSVLCANELLHKTFLPMIN